MSAITINLPVNGMYQPCDESVAVMRADFNAYARKYAVISPNGVWFHGNWETLEQAQGFARSMPRYAQLPQAQAMEVNEYLYCPAYGRVAE